MTDHRAFCDALTAWAELKEEAERPHVEEGKWGRFASAWSEVRLQIEKSCLLDRMFNGDEKPSQTPCPVHAGKWSGIHWAWPGTFSTVIKTGEKIPNKVSDTCQEWYDAGCRCFQHKCGCTTGWNPDEHCGCLERRVELDHMENK